jgi:hypothetical protein
VYVGRERERERERESERREIQRERDSESSKQYNNSISSNILYTLKNEDKKYNTLHGVYVRQ